MSAGGYLRKASARAAVLGLLIAPAALAAAEATAAGNRVVVNADQGKVPISRMIYGHFSEHLGRCIYGGYWVGDGAATPAVRGIRTDVVEALKRIRIPVLRWPGGCFADTYHWKDGIGPREKRPSIVNTHWGGVTENNHFGTHEFFDLCGLLGCEAYICGNVGSGTVREMAEWVEYATFDGQSPMADWRRANGQDKPWKLAFFGVGNENWGCGGTMRPEYYADVYRQFQTYIRNFGSNKVSKIACGSYEGRLDWTEVLMERAADQMDGLSLHYYTVPGGWERMNSATEFGAADWFETMRLALKIDDYISAHATVMDRYDPKKRVGMVVDEWGTWYKTEPGTNPSFLYQQNTLRDALVAGLTLNVFNAHADRVKMACLAQTVNVLQAVVLTEGERMVLTPTYHVFDMYQVHQDATLLPSDVTCGEYRMGDAAVPALSASASKDAAGVVHVTLCNLDPDKAAPVTVEVRGCRPASVSGRVLTAAAMNAHNTLEKPDAIRPMDFKEAKLAGNAVTAVLPAKSVVLLTIR